MNRLLRRAIVLALTGTMTLGMNATVFAADDGTKTNTTTDENSKYTKNGDNVTADTATINLIKDYVCGNGSATDSVSPAEDFVFTITPYGVWNAGSSTGDANGNAAPTTNIGYNAWAANNYKNSENTIVKVNDVQNTYYAGNLVIKKEVTGNAGDKDKYFKVTVKFTKPEGTIVNSDIQFTAMKKADGSDTYTPTNFVIKGQYYTSVEDDTNIVWKSEDANSAATLARTATCTFWVKDETTVTFSNIPYGINYSIDEAAPTDDTCTHTFAIDQVDSVTKFDGVDLTQDKVTGETDNNSIAWSNAKAVGSITDANDTVTITNNKESAIDVGVITSNAPYVAVLILAAAALALYVRRRKDMFEE